MALQKECSKKDSYIYKHTRVDIKYQIIRAKTKTHRLTSNLKAWLANSD